MDPKQLKLIAEDQQKQAQKRGDAVAVARYTSLLNAIAAVAQFEDETNEWSACLRCPLAFPNQAEHSAHYGAAHRGAW